MSVDPDPLLGRIISERYEIVSLINAGGMGVVYRAKQRSLDRPVALKFIHPQFLASEGSVRRFMEEARAVSRMNHPHVVSVFDFGRTPEPEGGYLFLVMELLTGPDLAKVLSHERLLPLSRVANIIIQTLEALAEAHHLGIVHRDVKPENIVLEPTRSGEEHVKVIDFGIAKIEAGGGGAEAERICGTPSYMAPEQISGTGGPSADIYSAGVMLFEMLAGQLPPKEPPPLADAGSMLHLDPRRIAPRRGITEALAAVCVRALQVDPERRFPDAQSFAQAIRAAMAGTSAGSPEAVWSRVSPPAPKRSISATLPALSTRDGQSSPPRSGVASLPGVASGTSDAPSALRPPMLGRQDDVSWACDLLRSDRPPPAIGFWGRPGIGRTRLLREVAACAEDDGALVVSVGLPPHPSDEVGYVGLRHVVRALSGLTPAALMDDRELGPIDRSALTGLRVLFSRAKGPSEPNAARRTSEAALGWAMERAVARSELGRVVLALDDLDRLDGASYLALRDRLRSGPIDGVTVLVTSQHVRTVVPLAGVREHMLRGLSREDAVQMLSSLRASQRAEGGEEGASSDREAPRSEGSLATFLPRTDDDIEPLYVLEVAACDPTLVPDLPGTLEEIVSRRQQALTVGQRRILLALAIVGVYHLENLAILLRHPGDLDAVLESLVLSGWIERRGAHVLLRHEVYGTVVQSGAPHEGAVAIHRAAAHQLRDSRQLSELRAYHAIQGSADFEAFVMLEDVARQRSARGDEEGAIAALSRAVAAARVQRAALDETAAASAALGVFGRKLAVALVAAERIEEAQAVLDEVLNLAEPRGMTRAVVLEQLAMVADLRGRTDEADQRRREALEIAERTDDQKLKKRLRDAMNRSNPPPPLFGDDAPARPIAKASSPPPPPPQGQRPVLIVEDDRSIREGLQSVLESEGYQAFGAGNGREALELLRKIPRPGLILLDLMMPVMTGWEVLEALRADDELSDIPVVVVSAVSERNKVAASRVLRKPVEVGMLLGIVEEFCA